MGGRGLFEQVNLGNDWGSSVWVNTLTPLPPSLLKFEGQPCLSPLLSAKHIRINIPPEKKNCANISLLKLELRVSLKMAPSPSPPLGPLVVVISSSQKRLGGGRGRRGREGEVERNRGEKNEGGIKSRD